MEYALLEGRVQKELITYINAHGTSTHHNDLFETRAIKLAFGEHAKEIRINSTKSMIGHLLGAAGAIEAIACIKSIEEGVIPPTINLNEVDPAICSKLNFTPLQSCERDVFVALNNTFGFGGHNSSVIFKRC